MTCKQEYCFVYFLKQQHIFIILDFHCHVTANWTRCPYEPATAQFAAGSASVPAVRVT